MIKTCEMHDHRYTIITTDDIVIPPDSEYDSFQKIRWKNFLSTGNHPTEVNLNEGNTTLIIGSNGVVSPPFLDAPTFVLYGKSFRKINKGQLINTYKREGCLVEIEFEVNSVNWKIQRGSNQTSSRSIVTMRS